MDLGIAGRIALVSGGTAGIGRAIAAELVAEGVQVVVSSRDADRASATAREIGGAFGIAWDTSDVAAVDGVVDHVEGELGPIDVAIVNTGGPPANPDALAFDDEQWEEAHRKLVRGPMALLRRIVPGMRERGWGRVVNVVSTTVREPIPQLVLSNAERSAALTAFKTLSRQVAGDGVTLNSLLTGQIETDRIASIHGSMDAARENARSVVPAARLGDPAEMAAVAAFLCSDRAAYVTGAAIPVDGGLLRGVW